MIGERRIAQAGGAYDANLLMQQKGIISPIALIIVVHHPLDMHTVRMNNIKGVFCIAKPTRFVLSKKGGVFVRAHYTE